MIIELGKTYPCRNNQQAKIIAFDEERKLFVARVEKLVTGNSRYFGVDPVCAEKYHYGMAVNGVSRDYDILGEDFVE